MTPIVTSGLMLLLGIVLGFVLARYMGSRSAITDQALDTAAAKFVEMASKHEAATHQAQVDASNATAKRALLLSQTLAKFSSQPPPAP